jgi:hypothetical protein
MEITRKELKQDSKYKKASALDKLFLENAYLPEARKYRKSFEIPLEIIGGIGMPIGLYYLSKKGLAAPNPDVVRYGLAGLVGIVSGWAIGLSLGTLTYETFSKEGDINQFISKIKNKFTKK